MQNLGFTTFVDHAPGKSVPNSDLHQFSDIERRTGIQCRNIAGPDETVASIGVDAARKFFKALGASQKDNLGALVIGSCSELKVQELANTIATDLHLKLPDSMIQGINFACSTFPAAVERAMAMKTDGDRLVIMTETMSRIVNWDEENTAIVFGDRASAFSISKEGPHEILHAFAEVIEDPRELIRLDRVDNAKDENGEFRSRDCIRMNGTDLFKLAPGKMVEAIEASLERMGEKAPDINDILAIVPHQANGRFIKKIKDKIRDRGWSDKLIVDEIAQMGNVAGSSIPSVLAHVRNQLAEDKIVACPAIGAGPCFERGKLTWGNVLFRVGQDR